MFVCERKKETEGFRAGGSEGEYVCLWGGWKEGGKEGEDVCGCVCVCVFERRGGETERYSFHLVLRRHKESGQIETDLRDQ